jgi:hypothetical protein
MNWPALQKALEAWLTATTGVATVQTRTSQTPVPVPPYISLTLGAMKQRGSTAIQTFTPRDDGSMLRQYQAPHELEVSVQLVSALGADPGDALTRLHAATEDLDTEARIDAFRQAGVVVSVTDDVKDVPVLLETVWSQRAVLTLALHTMEGATDVVAPIENVDLQNDL